MQVATGGSALLTNLIVSGMHLNVTVSPGLAGRLGCWLLTTPYDGDGGFCQHFWPPTYERVHSQRTNQPLNDSQIFWSIVDVIGSIDYRCDNKRFWLSAHNCQAPTPTSQNLEFEQQIRIFGAD